MADIFISITNMSVNAAWLIAAVIILRFFLKNMSKKYVMALWALVGIRLMCPFTIESVLSLIPSADIVSDVTSEYGKPVGESAGTPIIVNGADSAVDNAADNAERMINPVMKDSADTSVKYGGDIFEIFFQAAAYVWCAVFVLLLLYLAVSYVHMKKKTDVKMYLDDKVWLCDGIDIPFILGVVKPQIYLPSSINIVQSDYVIKHEKMHIKYYDYIWKPLGFLILAVH
ncbi:MAG: M56 family metallopeptidase, partial [Lachnospiraceae bacterium]|nr:M56 family metallopeptidase [Lachnospiraceae bacterium]